MWKSLSKLARAKCKAIYGEAMHLLDAGELESQNSLVV